jgi:putative acetyltransferase
LEEVTVETVTVATAEVRELIDELDRTLAHEYLPEQRHGLELSAIFAPHVRFFIARTGNAAVGCGGVAFYETFGEVKRMYVRPTARGGGVARALLSRIETETRANGYGVLRLETGDRQAAAIRLYERAGFRRCGAFGDYAAMNAPAIATSVFFEKRLDR